MEERRTARRYDLTLPISIRFAAERLVNRQEGKTRDISTRGLYFVIGQDVDAGSKLDITLTLPAEITHGTDVFCSRARESGPRGTSRGGWRATDGSSGGDRALRHYSWRTRASLTNTVDSNATQPD